MFHFGAFLGSPKTLLKNAERRKKQKLSEASLTDQLRTIIVSVGGNTERSYINSFIDNEL